MSQIVVFGGNGYAGENIVREAVIREHDVISVSRSTPTNPVPGAKYVAGSIYDSALLNQLAQSADVFVSAVPSKSGEHRLPDGLGNIVQACIPNNVRFGVVGGAGTLLVSEGGEELRIAFASSLPKEAMPEINTHAELLEALRGSPESFDWFFLSPALLFGAHAPGKHLGFYRVGGDVMLKDEEGNSTISGTDYADAILDEIEFPKHFRTRFSVAY
jgi:putative NADH-flavin reductase